VVFQIPPAAAATKNVFDGLGIPVTLDTRPPMFAGPMLRQRKPASSVESSVMPLAAGACAGTPVVTVTLLGGCRRGCGKARGRVVSVDAGAGGF